MAAALGVQLTEKKLKAGISLKIETIYRCTSTAMCSDNTPCRYVRSACIVFSKSQFWTNASP